MKPSTDVVGWLIIDLYLNSIVVSRVGFVDSTGSVAQKHLDEHAQDVSPLESTATARLLGRLSIQNIVPILLRGQQLC